MGYLRAIGLLISLIGVVRRYRAHRRPPVLSGEAPHRRALDTRVHPVRHADSQWPQHPDGGATGSR